MISRIKIERGLISLIIANAVGIIGYLWVEAWIMAPRFEENAFTGIDAAGYWIFRAFPLLLVFLLLNIVWIVYAAIKNRYKLRWLVLTGIFLASAWIGAMSVYGLDVYLIEFFVLK